MKDIQVNIQTNTITIRFNAQILSLPQKNTMKLLKIITKQ